MIDEAGMHHCHVCGKVYKAESFQKAIESEVKRLKDEHAEQYANAFANEMTAILELDPKYMARKARIDKLEGMAIVHDAYQYCSEKCRDIDEERLKPIREKARIKEEKRKAYEKRVAAEDAKNRHNPLYILSKYHIFLLLDVLLCGAIMFLLWRSVLPIPVIAIASAVLSFLWCWVSTYKLFNKFDLKKGIIKFSWIFLFLYALQGALEVVCELSYDIPYIEDITELLGREFLYIPMVFLALVVTFLHTLLRKPLFRKIPYGVSRKLANAAKFAIPMLCLFHILSHWIEFPISAIIAVAAPVFADKKLETLMDDYGDLAFIVICLANLVLSEVVFL